MSDKKQCQSLVMGAAIVTGIVGTFSALIYFSHADNEKERKEKREIINKNVVLGGVAGGLVAAATALLLAPKAGSELIKDLAHPFSNEGKEEHPPSSDSTSSIPTTESNKTKALSSKEGNGSETDLKIETSKKKSPPRRGRGTSQLGETVEPQQPPKRTRRIKEKLDKVNTENDSLN